MFDFKSGLLVCVRYPYTSTSRLLAALLNSCEKQINLTMTYIICSICRCSMAAICRFKELSEKANSVISAIMFKLSDDLTNCRIKVLNFSLLIEANILCSWMYYIAWIVFADFVFAKLPCNLHATTTPKGFLLAALYGNISGWLEFVSQ